LPEPLPAAAGPVGGRAKRAVDLALAVPLAVATAPVMAAIAVWVRRDSPGPALYRQQRIGYAGEPFTLVKFRTMVVGAEGMGAGLAVSAGDSRITRAGRTLRRLSLDELPQIWNVIRGDMSLVGPRPTVASQVELYDARQRRRLLARPGVTGLAQVSGRNAIPWSERIEIDVRYVESWTPRRDIAILARTARVVLGRGGTYTGERGGFDLGRRKAPDG
jgi:lipopolysaccharide/colanic/teichoic acid biosynthesis glycosyltransferase